MWPWEWKDTLKRRKDGYELVNREPPSSSQPRRHKKPTATKIQWNRNHVKGLGVVLVVAAIILFYRWPRAFMGTIPDVSHIKHRYRSKGSLTFRDRQFYLNKLPIKIISGTMHYYRVVPQYWEERMKKMKVCGLNTLQTSIPWNLHEKKPGVYDFGQNLDLTEYLDTAQRVGLHVILKVGPYIGDDLDLGGLPSWLLRDPSMLVRSNKKEYLSAVIQYFTNLMPIFIQKQYHNGGPVIAVAVESQFGSFSDDVSHLHFLKKTLVKVGLSEMILTSDGWNPHGQLGTAVAPFHDEALPTASFRDFEEGKLMLEHISGLSKDFPLFVMDFWSGGPSYWGDDTDSGSTVSDFSSNLEMILQTGASVNFYMFHGGTNFGFIAGGRGRHGNYQPGVTSYDYGAPLTESGDITPKYKAITDLLLKYDYVRPEALLLPEVSQVPLKTAYGSVDIQAHLSFDDMLSRVKAVQSSRVLLTMEELTTGQRFGYLLYRAATVPRMSLLRLTDTPRDRLQILMNGFSLAVWDWTSDQRRLDISHSMFSHNVLDLFMENMGRDSEVISGSDGGQSKVNQGSDWLDSQRKGLTGDVLVDHDTVEHWTLYTLDFTPAYINRVKVFEKWRPVSEYSQVPGLFRTELDIDQPPTDTFLSLTGWEKGVVFVNGQILGRYWNIGPQRTLYIPAPLLRRGTNSILIFEEHKAGRKITFTERPDLGRS